MNKNGPLDPRIDKLVAHLYGELPEKEAREVERMIAADPEIRREWEELQGTHAMLAEWKVQEESPGFVFVDDPSPAGRRRAGGWLDRFRSLALATPWAVAAAAVVIAVFAVGGAFRIERTNGSIAFRFGRPPAVVTQLASNPNLSPDMASPLSGAVPLGGAPVQPVDAPQANTPEIRQVSGQYMTKREFEAYSAGMMQTLVVLLNEYGKEHDREVGTILQTALTDVTNKQIRDYGDLRSRIEALGVGVGNLGYRLEQRDGQLSPMPAVETPATGTKGEEK